MTWVKLCGMTRRADVEAAERMGADAVGFVIAAESPRAVEPAEAAVLGKGLEIDRYLVTVDLKPTDLLDAAKEADVTGVQPHGRYALEAAVAALAAGLAVLFPVPVLDQIDLQAVPDGSLPLLDASDPHRHGGTGRSFDWNLTAGLDTGFVLAGGLRADNVARAVAETGAWGVDVASGVETTPGVKDVDMMMRFLEVVR